MSELRVFISSTCYDLSLLRAQLRGFIKSIGYEPVMSDFEDILYDPRNHTHASCIDEVSNCDMLILIIGSRFGGKAKPEALSKVSFELLKNESANVDSLKNEENLSVTQLEVLKAIESGMPIYTFIDKRVWHDHLLYEKNKNSEIIDKIIFPSIDKQETAKYIFDFINFVRLRNINNTIFPFEKGQDIEEILKKQWSYYFQRLLREQRIVDGDRKRLDILSERFEDLKTAILTSINDGSQKDIARGVVKYRTLLDFLCSLKRNMTPYITSTQDSWEKMLEAFDICRIVNPEPQDFVYEGYTRVGRMRLFLEYKDGSFCEARITLSGLERLQSEWESFIKLSSKNREVIAEALAELPRGMGMIRHHKEKFVDVYPQYALTNSSEDKLDEQNSASTDLQKWETVVGAL